MTVGKRAVTPTEHPPGCSDASGTVVQPVSWYSQTFLRRQPAAPVQRQNVQRCVSVEKEDQQADIQVKLVAMFKQRIHANS